MNKSFEVVKGTMDLKNKNEWAILGILQDAKFEQREENEKN